MAHIKKEVQDIIIMLDSQTENFIPRFEQGCFFISPEPGFFKLLRRPRIDSKESIPPAYVAWRAGTATLFLLGS